MNINKFWFICVNYNNFQATKNFIESVINLRREENEEVKIIVVDNNSIKEEKEKIKKYIHSIPEVILIENEKNLGYFGGLNEGLKIVNDAKKSFVIIGNNDIKFEISFIEKLKRINLYSKLMVICPDIITKDGKHQNPHLIKKITKFERIKSDIYFINYYLTQILILIYRPFKKLLELLRKNISSEIYEKTMKIRMGRGACYILTPNFYDHFNQLIDEVFMWGEEAVFANQIEQVGGEVLYCPNLKVYHEENASVSKLASKEKFYIKKASYKKYKKYL